MGTVIGIVITSLRCWNCGMDYDEHSMTCPVTEERKRPHRFRYRCIGKHPNGTDFPWRHGTYFPLTDLVVGDMGGRGTGKPKDVEWIDEEPT